MGCFPTIVILDLSRIQKQKKFSIVLNESSAGPGELN